MISTRVASITAVVIASLLSGATPYAAPQSRAAETRQQGPSAGELADVRAALSEYRKLWAELDGETRGIARQYGAPTPDELERMFRDWESGRGSMPSLPGNMPGRLADTFKNMPGNSAPAAPAKPGEELPDFAKGAAQETLDTLKDAKVDLDDIRDKHAEAANCSPEAMSAKQALQTKLDAYRKALADMESARVDVDREKGAGAALERAALFGGAAGVIKSTADAAMDLFGAANSLFLGNNATVSTVGSLYGAATGAVATVTAANGKDAAVAALGTAAAATKAAVTGLSLTPYEIALLPAAQRPDVQSAQRAANLVSTAIGTSNKVVGTALLNSSQQSSDTATSRAIETTGNVVQLSGTVKSTLATVLPDAPKILGATGNVFSGVGAALSATAKYDRKLDDAFGQILSGQDERRNLDGLNAATLRNIDAKRIEFMEKIAALEAEIARSGCVK